MVLHIMDLASKIKDKNFSDDQIDGGTEEVSVYNEEDMIVAVCYIAECITFNKPIKLDVLNIEEQRMKILDVFLSLLNFK